MLIALLIFHWSFFIVGTLVGFRAVTRMLDAVDAMGDQRSKARPLAAGTLTLAWFVVTGLGFLWCVESTVVVWEVLAWVS